MNVDELKNVKKVKIFIDNKKIDGEIVEVDKWGKMTISVLSEIKTIPVELGKRGEIFFEKDSQNFFVSGKIFSQGIKKLILIPDTDILEEKRKNERLETPFISVKLINKTGILHKEIVNGNILNISFSGVKIETNIPLKENTIYDIETTFNIKHKNYLFKAKCKLIFTKKVKNVFINGLKFIDIDPYSFQNLSIYIKALKHELGKDTLNY
ncbi:MAG: PilZ domain-containing protein [Candidatus Omnitrophica bacterium]|nr:PilZ domain-containing protein [Candidatus Omnitrophota bacterium]